MTEAKSENWKGLLTENKLGILASIRNIRNILLNKPESSTVDKLCDLISNGEEILKGKIMPYQLDMANEVLISEFNDSNARKISKSLLTGYEKALPNLAELLTGNNLVMIDMSGSMGTSIMDPNRKTRYRSTCMSKASLIGMTIAKATNADVIRFGSSAEYVNYNSNQDVFSLANNVQKNMGGTSLSEAWRVAERSGRSTTVYSSCQTTNVTWALHTVDIQVMLKKLVTHMYTQLTWLLTELWQLQDQK